MGHPVQPPFAGPRAPRVSICFAREPTTPSGIVHLARAGAPGIRAVPQPLDLVPVPVLGSVPGAAVVWTFLPLEQTISFIINHGTRSAGGRPGMTTAGMPWRRFRQD